MYSDSPHPYEVSRDKALAFFKDVMFRRTTIKKIFLNRDYSYPFAAYPSVEQAPKEAVVLLGNPKKKGSRVVMDLMAGKWIPSGIDSAMYLLLSNVHVHSPSSPSLFLVVDKLMEHGSGNQRHKLLFLSCGKRVMLQARSALAYLQRRQGMRLHNKNAASSLQGCLLLGNAIESYSKQLVYGSIPLLKNVGIQYGYTTAELTRMLLQTLFSEEWLTHAKLRIQLREHAKIALRHVGILRDQDVRGLNQSDCGLAPLPQDPIESKSKQPAWMLLFRFRHSKTNQTGERHQYAAFVRHEDVRRCAVGAFALHLMFLFKVT